MQLTKLHIIALLLLTLCLPRAQGALAQAILYTTDTSATNARPSAVTISPSTGGTNLMAGTLTSTNNTTVGAQLHVESSSRLVGAVTNDALQASTLVYSTATKALGSLNLGTAGQVLTSAGAGVAPSFQAPFTGTTGTVTGSGTTVANDIAVFTDTTHTNIARSTGAGTVGDASSATYAWTFNLSGATDPTVTAANNLLTFNTPVVATSFASSVSGASFYQRISGVATIQRTSGTDSVEFSGNGMIVVGWVAFGTSVSGADAAWARDGAAATLQAGFDASTPAAQVIKGADGSGTDRPGSDVTWGAGKSTGTGRGGASIIATTPSATTSSTANSYSTRGYYSAKAAAMTDTTAVGFATISVASGKFAGAVLTCTINAADASDFQSITSQVRVDAVNKAGTVTPSISQTDNTAAVSAGTITVAYTAVASGNTVEIRANPDTSLTPTTLNITWIVTALNSDGVATVTPL